MRLRSLHAGFTLIEVLIGLVIFSIGALGVLAMVTTTLHLNQNSRQMTEATQLGIRQMERLQIVPVPLNTNEYQSACDTRCWLDPGLAVSTTAIALQPSNLIGNTAGSNLFYQVSWKRTALSAPNSGLNHLEVSVHWPRNRDLQGTDWTATIDCQTNPGLCYVAQFHSYR